MTAQSLPCGEALRRFFGVLLFAETENVPGKLPDNGLPRNRQDGVELYTGNGNETEWYGGYQEGQEPGMVYGYVVEKMARSESDFPAGYYVTSGHWNGKYQYAPADYDKLSAGDKANSIRLQGGDGHIDVHDQAVLGNTIPHWTGGFNTTLSWKGLSLYARFDYALGFYLQDWYNSNGMVWMLGCMQGTYNMPTLVKDTWTPENPNARFPRYVWADQLGPGNYYKVSRSSSTAAAGTSPSARSPSPTLSRRRSSRRSAARV